MFEHFAVESFADATVLRLQDSRLSATRTISELEDELLAYVESTRPMCLVIDFGAVKLCSTAVINGLLRTKKRLISHQGKLILAGMKRSIRSAFKVLNLDGTVFPIYNSVEQAIRSP